MEINIERVITTIAAAAVIGVVVWAIDDSAEDAKVAAALDGVVRANQEVVTELGEIRRVQREHDLHFGRLESRISHIEGRADGG